MREDYKNIRRKTVHGKTPEGKIKAQTGMSPEE